MSRLKNLVSFSSVADIIEAVKHLSEEEKEEFLDQLREIEFEDSWDRQTSIDANAGKLDFWSGTQMRQFARARCTTCQLEERE